MSAVVLDTCVMVAGLIAHRGASAELVGAFFDNRLTLAFTSEMLGEYAEVLQRPEFAEVITPNDRIAVILKLRASGKLLKPAPVPAANWPDEDDLPFVAAALATERKILVTLNPKDFAPATTFGVRVPSPSEARRELL